MSQTNQHIIRRSGSSHRSSRFHDIAAGVNERAKRAYMRRLWPAPHTQAQITYQDLPKGWVHTPFSVGGREMHMTHIPAMDNRPFQGSILYITGLNSFPCDHVALYDFLTRQGYEIFEYDIAHPRNHADFVPLSSHMVHQVLTSRDHPAADRIASSQTPVILLAHSTGGMLVTEHAFEAALQREMARRFTGVITLCAFYNAPSTRPGSYGNRLFREYYMQKHKDRNFGSLWLDIAYGTLNWLQGEMVTPAGPHNAVTYADLDRLFHYADGVRERGLSYAGPPLNTVIPSLFVGATKDPSSDTDMIAQVADSMGARHDTMPGWHRPIEDPNFPWNRRRFINYLKAMTPSG